MNFQHAIVFASCIASLCAVPAALAVEEGADFMLGTWTRDGDCKDGDVIQRDGPRYKSKIRGLNYVGTVQREGDTIKTNFASDDGNARRYTYHIENDNRLRIVDLVVCDRVRCELMHVQSFFYVMRCAE